MLSSRVQFKRGEDQFNPAKPRNQSQDRNLQRSRSCGSNGIDNGYTPDAATSETISSSSNLERFLNSTTPSIAAYFIPKTKTKGWRNPAADDHHEQQPYFVLGDLWEAFKEWSAYGNGVPLLLNNSDLVMQYYVPYLSAIQLYADPRGRGEEGDDIDFSRDSSSEGNSDFEIKESKLERTWNPDSLGEPPSGDQETEDPQPRLLFEYLERDLPYCREPLTDKIAALARLFPELETLRSCDVAPSSWISVAWYPIYRIPTGPTLRDLDACFLTFHTLSTTSRASKSTVSWSCGKERMSLPSFGLASYKMMDKMWEGTGCPLASYLNESAERWLRHRRVAHPDYQFFSSHGPCFR